MKSTPIKLQPGVGILVQKITCASALAMKAVSLSFLLFPLVPQSVILPEVLHNLVSLHLQDRQHIII
jgi:hypothetical protein